MTTGPEAPPRAATAYIPPEVFVEVVPLLIVGLFTGGGFELSGGTEATGVTPLLGASLGACVGYVHGGIVGRLLRKGMVHFEDRVERTSATSLLAGAIGAVLLGVLGAVIGGGAVALLPRPWGWPVLGLFAWLGVYGGFQAGARKGDELLPASRAAERASFSAGAAPGVAPEVPLLLVDTSAAIDGRLVALARTGFLPGPLAVPRFVLDELQAIADANDVSRRRRGRRGIETLEALREEASVGVTLLDEEIPEMEEVDAKLVVLARRLGARILTVDANLCSSAELQGVRCCNIHRLGRALQPALVPGEVVRLKVSKEGRDEGQGVAYLDDGTMVVISDAAGLVGADAEVSITRSMQTARGRMFFASVSD
ncbi:MAG: TRAM domain-containing protein [Acidimicrobiia bacterium]|nr:TRAM domain-containing protein [Acidimicrobiia bacterium]